MVNYGYSTVPSSNRSIWVTTRFRIIIILGCIISLRFSPLQLTRNAFIGLKHSRWWVGVITCIHEIYRNFKRYNLVESPSPIVSLLCLRVDLYSMWLLRFTFPSVDWIGWLDYAWRWSSWSQDDEGRSQFQWCIWKHIYHEELYRFHIWFPDLPSLTTFCGEGFNLTCFSWVVLESGYLRRVECRHSAAIIWRNQVCYWVFLLPLFPSSIK